MRYYHQSGFNDLSTSGTLSACAIATLSIPFHRIAVLDKALM